MRASTHQQELNSGSYSQLGVTLLEVLVGLLLVALISVTASVASLRAQQGQQQAYETSVATNLAQEIFERMRANPNHLVDYSFSKTHLTSAADCPDSGAALAATDIATWCQRLVSSLPNPSFSIVSQPSEYQAELRLSWSSRLTSGYFTRLSNQGARVELVWPAVSLRVHHDE